MKTQLYKINLLIIFLLFSACASNQQNIYEENKSSTSLEFKTKEYKLIEQSDKSIDFLTFISSINSVIVVTEPELEKSLNIEDQFQRKYYKLIKHYLTEIGIENIAVTQDEQTWISNNIPLENTANLHLSFDITKNYISKVFMTFKSCNGAKFKFSTESDYYIDANWDDYLFAKLMDMYSQKIKFNPDNAIPLKRVMTKWNSNLIKRNFDDFGSDGLEGIYEKYGVGNSEAEFKYTIAVINEDDKYNIIYIDGAKNTNNWNEGELKGTITKTSIKDFYKVKWIMSDKAANENVYLNTSKYNFLEFDFLNAKADYKTQYLKMYPVISNNTASSNNYLSSGTGFFISNEGYLVTNQHIVQDATNISIQLKNNNTLQEFKADVVSIDKKNDLAILKVNSNDFSIENNVPFEICNEESPLGTAVFTMGYPMIETMGESLKLSDGIISSQSGYMASNSTYQVTVPINPGNSGGPLFDKAGNLVGIINAKYTGAENVAYAIKSKILLDMLKDINVSIPKSEAVNNQEIDLVENAKKLNSWVCLIKIYN